MGMEHIHQGAQMALQAFGIVDQAKQRAMMEKLTGAQIGQIEAGQAQKQQMSDLVSKFQQGLIMPGSFSGGPDTRTPTGEDLSKLAVSMMGVNPEVGVSLLGKAQAPEQQAALEYLKAKLQYHAPVSVPEGATVIDPVTHETIATGKPKEIKLSAEQDLIRKSLFDKLGREPTSAEIYKQEQQGKIDVGRASGEGRAKAYGDIRQITVLDTKKNNEMITMTAGEFNDKNKIDPGRYVDSTKMSKALTQTALIEDIHGAIANARGSVDRLKTDFDEKSRMLLYKAVTSANPTGMIDNFINGQFGKNLTQDQIDYLTDLNQLIENAMAMRSVLGAGQGSDQLRDAIKGTVPNAGTFSKAMAQAQLNKFEQQLSRLERGIPKVGLANPRGNIGSQRQGNNLKVGRFSVEVQ